MDVILRLIDEESLGPLLFDAERFAFRIDGEQAQIVAAPRDIRRPAYQGRG